MKISLSASETIMITHLLNDISLRRSISLDKINGKICQVENSPAGETFLTIDTDFINAFIDIISSKLSIALGMLITAKGMFESFGLEMDTLKDKYKEKAESEPIYR